MTIQKIAQMQRDTTSTIHFARKGTSDCYTVFQEKGKLKTFRKIKWDDGCVTIVTCDQDVKTVRPAK